jgi:hypothetical protein
VVELNKKLAARELKDIDVRDKDISDESVGRPWKKKNSKPYTLSTSEEKFILHIHSCISMHLGFVIHSMMMNGVIVFSQVDGV